MKQPCKSLNGERLQGVNYELVECVHKRFDNDLQEFKTVAVHTIVLPM